MPEFVSVKTENGLIATVSKEFAEAAGLKPLDPEKYPAVDSNDKPLAQRADEHAASTPKEK